MAWRLALCHLIRTDILVEAHIAQFPSVRLRTGGDASGSPVIIGSSLSLDCCSSYASFGRQYYSVWEMAMQWITETRGGIRLDGPNNPPRPLELVVYNDYSNTSIVSTIFTEMVKNGSSILLAPYSTELTAVAANIANKTGALLMATGSVATSVFKGRPTVFGTFPPADAFILEAWNAILPTTRRVATVRSAPQCSGVASQALKSNVTLILDKTISSISNVSLVVELVGKLKNDPPDSLFLCLYPQQCRDFAAEMKRQNLNPKATVFAICFTDSTYWDMGELPLFFLGLTPYVPSFPMKSEITNFTAQSFADKVYQRYGFIPGYQAMSGWIGFLALIDAIERAQSLNVTEVSAQLANTSLQTEQGLLTFDQNRQNTVSVKGVQMFAPNQNPDLVLPEDLQQRPFYYPMPTWTERSCLSKSSSNLGFLNGVCDYCPAGHISAWLNSTSQRLCNLCPLGTETGFDFISQASVCSLCPAGKSGFLSGGTPECLACDPGTYTNMVGLSECTLCPVKTFQNLKGQTSCVDCPEGHFSNTIGLSWCQVCPRNTFQDDQGQVDCKPCAASRVTVDPGASRQAMCVCDDGFHDFSNSTGSTCQSCPEGLVCPGGGGKPSQALGYWVDFTDSLQAIVRCTQSVYCPLGAFGQCATNRVGRACGTCQRGTFPAGQGVCDDCGSSASLPVQVTLIVLLCLLLLVGIYWLAGRGTRVVRGSIQELQGSVTVGLLAIQGLYAFSSLDIEWAQPLNFFRTWLSFFQVRIDFLMPTCTFDVTGALGTFLISLCVVPIMMVYLVLVHAVRHVSGCGTSINQLCNALGRVAWFTYLPVFLLCLLPFRCISNPIGPQSLLQNRSVACWSDGDHTTMVTVACFAIILFPLMFLCIAIHTCRQYPRRIAMEDGVQFLERFDFFYGNFQAHRYYFVLVVMFRNALFALTPAAITEYAGVHVILMGLVLFMYALAQVNFLPWKGKMPNALDVISCFTLMVVALIGSILSEHNIQDTWAVSILGCGLALSGFALLFFSVRVSFLFLVPWKKYAAFLSHHKGGAAVLARFFKEVLIESLSRQIFLDCDDLADLDCLAEVVGEQTKTLVSILTREYFSRMWCAVEIVTAFKCNVKIILVACDDYLPITEEWLKGLESVWKPTEWAELQANGCAVDSIRATYEAIMAMKTMPFKHKGSLSEKHSSLETLAELLHSFSLHKATPSSSDLKIKHSCSLSKADVLITGAVGDAEGLCTCQLLQRLLQRSLLRSIATVVSAHDAHSASSAKYLVIVLTPGVLSDLGFAHVLMTAGRLEMISVLATKYFSFPTIEFYDSLLLGQALPQDDRIDLTMLVDLLKHVFKTLSVDFRATASRSILLLEVRQLATRFTFDGKVASTCTRFHSEVDNLSSACPEDVDV